MRMNSICSSCLVFLCVVDQIIDQTVVAEASNAVGQIEIIQLPSVMIPCDVKEGDVFYVINEAGVVEVRCGEPEPG